ncbi:hypothetical protein SAPIO_CDS2949 [Scedosporium apiospermum]|uniref:Uncharacterized protein n=1 Tax=Pseudallescheria apiosperma TaxID=563466 RepID=A0A084GBW6_PSEDA|nr:uncharacterized protein SAPIO_CDS2949 [Scedosporium apiospermum]KEZ44828.1 hypothetical protein SAPIO_CDS2949 [Scedosporium apiospermum]
MLATRILRSAKGAKPNITGFDISKLRAAAGTPKYDPWERTEAWRYRGPFTRWNRFKGTLPGLGTATVAFTIYCLYEHFFLNDEHHHGHSEGHGTEKH